MNNKSFVKQLEQKLPYWQAQGWLEQSGADAILNDSQSGIQKSHKLSIILAMMGVMLLAAGAISFFAANWQGMSKLLKLGLLFSSMISAYVVSAYCLSANKLSIPRYPAMGQAFLLLGVLLFGNNIMLVAQIYHIDSHYPNGVLLWGIGALFTTILMRSEIVMILVVLLSLLWTGMEIFDFQKIHWQWLIFWSIASYFIIRYNFSLAAHFSQLSLFIWALMSLYSFSDYLSPVYLIQIYLLLGILLFLLARLLQLLAYQQAYNETLSFYAFIFSLVFLYILSFPDLDFATFQSSIKQSSWTIMNLILMTSIVLLLWVQIKIKKNKMHIKELKTYQLMGIIWLFALLMTLFLNVYFFNEYQNLKVIMINCLILFLVIWLIFMGLAEHKKFYVNTAFIVFAMTLVSRYFDTFWSLMNHSLFFITGGVLLIAGGYWLEKKRRQLSQQLTAEGGENE